jgi:D-serine dehydratase
MADNIGSLSHGGDPRLLDKGLGRPGRLPRSPGAAPGWNLLREEVSLPVAVLDQDLMSRNLEWMQRFTAAYGVQLAPHGKTTMAPALFARQLAAGAWGITLATAAQCRVAHAHGVARVLMANQLVGAENLAIVSTLLADPGFSFCCLVDASANVDALGRFFAARNQRIDVLLELGVPGGRAGVRDEAGQERVLAAIARWPQAVRLVGVEVYEGVLKEEDEVRALLRRAVSVARALHGRGLIARAPLLLSGAGSAWYDVVAEEFAPATVGVPCEVVLRPGCYLTHDVGIYRSAQAQVFARNATARALGPGLEPALQLWAYVQSRPEPELAIIGLGKRDAAFDAGLPVPSRSFRPGGSPGSGPGSGPGPVPQGWRLTKMMDQHAFMAVGAGDELEIGDMISFDISHPCLTCDKWRNLLVIDAGYRVVDILPTYF